MLKFGIISLDGLAKPGLSWNGQTWVKPSELLSLTGLKEDFWVLGPTMFMNDLHGKLHEIKENYIS